MVDYDPHDYVQIILMHEMWVIVIVSNDLRGKDFQRIFIVLTNQIDCPQMTVSLVTKFIT